MSRPGNARDWTQCWRDALMDVRMVEGKPRVRPDGKESPRVEARLNWRTLPTRRYDRKGKLAGTGMVKMCQSHYALLSACHHWISGDDEEEDSFVVCPSRNLLALESGLSVSDVGDRLAELREAGAIIVKARTNTSSEFRIFRTAGIGTGDRWNLKWKTSTLRPNRSMR